jgi:hypothetical protein
MKTKGEGEVIYFMQAEGGGPIKIGNTGNLDNRRADLERISGRKQRVLATAEGGRTEERELQRRFDHLRIGRTEDYRPAPDLMEYLGLCAAAEAEWAAGSDEAREALMVESTPEWRDWLGRGAEYCRIEVSELLDVAATLYLRSRGFTEPPPEL